MHFNGTEAQPANQPELQQPASRSAAIRLLATLGVANRMPTRSEVLTLGRRLHNALRHAVEDPDNYGSNSVIREDFEHYACSMYLAGTLAFLEGKYGKRPWEGKGSIRRLDEFLADRTDTRTERLQIYGISEAGLQALVCIRNAIVHNNGDLSKNDDKTSLSKVSNASILGVALSRSSVQLLSSYSTDFMEYVRKSFVAVSIQHGDL